MLQQFLAAGAAAAMVSVAGASTITTFTDRSSFLSQVGSGVGPAETFDGLATTTSRGAVSGAFNDFVYTAALSPALPSGNGLGVLADPGSSDKFLVANALSTSQDFRLRVDFSGPDAVTAFGADMFRYDQSLGASVGGNLMVYVYDTMGDSLYGGLLASTGRSTFLGFTSDVAIGHFEVWATGPLSSSRYSAIDNLTFGVAVIPLPPAAWAGLATLGLAGGVRAWRRR